MSVNHTQDRLVLGQMWLRAGGPVRSTSAPPMSKSNNPDPEMHDEYDFSGAVRGKYAKRFAEGSNVVVLGPDVAEVFPDAAAVNEALRVLAKSAKRSQQAS